MDYQSNLPIGTSARVLHSHLDDFTLNNNYDSPCSACGEDTDTMCDDCGQVFVCPAHSVELNEHGVFYVCLKCAKARGFAIRECVGCSEERHMTGDLCPTCLDEALDPEDTGRHQESGIMSTDTYRAWMNVSLELSGMEAMLEFIIGEMEAAIGLIPGETESELLVLDTLRNVAERSRIALEQSQQVRAENRDLAHGMASEQEIEIRRAA